MNVLNLKYRRRKLRQDQTIEEEILWEELRNNKLGVKFRRQYSVSEYIVDFYCPKYKLAIEVDGSVHKTRKSYVEFRKKFIVSLGIRMIRFWGGQARNDLLTVLNVIGLNLTPTPLLGKARGNGRI
ncbi:MAG: DUF559 domain-containing protein [Candidatus Amesbacteria bacterium]|nr:DUF559 domain-containing protein [Candidatus Amesbacteria bacterium]